MANKKKTKTIAETANPLSKPGTSKQVPPMVKVPSNTPEPDAFRYLAVPAAQGNALPDLRDLLVTQRTVGIHFQCVEQHTHDSSETIDLVTVTLVWGPSLEHSLSTPLGKQKTTANDKKNDGAKGAAASPPVPWILHPAVMPRELFHSLMRALLVETHGRIAKVAHGTHRAAHWLHAQGVLEVDHDEVINLLDLQLAYEHLVNPRVRNATLTRVVKHYQDPAMAATVTTGGISYKEMLQTHLERDRDAWTRPLLAHKLLRFTVQQAQVVLSCMEEGKALLTTPQSVVREMYAMTSRRWRYAAYSDTPGSASVWFDVDHDFMPRSMECLGPESVIALQVPRLQMHSDIEPLLELLPIRFQRALAEVEGASDKLVDICLDVGRLPHAYMGRGKRVVLVPQEDRGNSSMLTFAARWMAQLWMPRTTPASVLRDCEADHVVQMHELEEILAFVGGEERIGSDNRVALNRQLHRVSVMRSKNRQEIYGLTLRIGRTLRFASNILLDLLLSSVHHDKSVLLLGHPGSGKTTLIRDIARCVSESGENVCIIDTSNEICGDGHVPHHCVGWARRMMVPSLDAQARVMIECVQNHTVETLIVDEIGRSEEVKAASTVRQRGPRVIASAHGDFHALLGNQELNGLVGGLQSVILGDAAASKLPKNKKVQSQRRGRPVFDVIVELDHEQRGRCRIIWDVAEAVDAVLMKNDEFHSEVRMQNPNLCGIQQSVNQIKACDA